MVSRIYAYRSAYSGNSYEFEFIDIGGGDWRIAINRQPSRVARASDRKVHRNRFSDYPFVCWDTPIKTLKAAKVVASQWAERADRWVRDRIPFEG